MDWEHAEDYEKRQALWDGIFPSAPEEVLDNDKIGVFRDWLLRRKSLKFSRRIATFEVYEIESHLGISGRLCERSERFMLKLTPKVVRGWNGEWEVWWPTYELGMKRDRTWRVIVQRLNPDSDRELISFKLIRSDNEGGMPFSPLSPRPKPARIVAARELDDARRSRYAARQAIQKSCRLSKN